MVNNSSIKKKKKKIAVTYFIVQAVKTNTKKMVGWHLLIIN